MVNFECVVKVMFHYWLRKTYSNNSINIIVKANSITKRKLKVKQLAYVNWIHKETIFQSFLTSWAQELKKVDDYLSAAYLVVYDQVIHTGSGRNELVLRCRIGKRRQHLNHFIMIITGCQIEGGRTILYINVKNIMYIYKLQNIKKKDILYI